MTYKDLDREWIFLLKETKRTWTALEEIRWFLKEKS